MEDEWRQELRRVVRPMLDRYLVERGLPGLPPAEFEMLLTYEPQPADGEPLTWLRDVTAGAVRLARARGTATGKLEIGAVTVDEPLPVEDLRWATAAEILALEACGNPYVADWRAHHLPPDGLVGRDAAAAFRRQLDDEARVRLDQVATALVEWHGWWDHDEAALFVLTGDPPTGRRIRTNIIVRDRVSASRVIVEADPRASPQAVADSYRRARSSETLAALDLSHEVARHHRLNGARPHPVTAKKAALALHLARHRNGSWAERRSLWNTSVEATQPDWVYTADAGFARDAGRAWAQVVGETFNHKAPAFRLPI
jgi:hypothetical protein